MSTLTETELDDLRKVYDVYMAAGPGQLNDTAEQLAKKCSRLGWSRAQTGLHCLVWTRRQLGVT